MWIHLNFAGTAAVIVAMPLGRVGPQHSAFSTLRHGGIRWREAFYPRATLRTGNVR